MIRLNFKGTLWAKTNFHRPDKDQMWADYHLQSINKAWSPRLSGEIKLDQNLCLISTNIGCSILDVFLENMQQIKMDNEHDIDLDQDNDNVHFEYKSLSMSMHLAR